MKKDESKIKKFLERVDENPKKLEKTCFEAVLIFATN